MSLSEFSETIQRYNGIQQAQVMNSNKDTLIVFATGWGAKFGGINSFNADLVSTFSATFKENVQTICFVLCATEDDVENALQNEVLLLSLTDDIKQKEFPLTLLSKVFQLLDAKKITDSLNERTVWLGHDRITGEIAIAAARKKTGKSVLVHHMSYAHYEGFNENSIIACQKIEGQETIFQQADIVIGVGPKLAAALTDRVKGAQDVQMLMPGLAAIDLARMPTTFTMFLSGRLEDRLKQAHLGIAGFSHAIKRADNEPLLPDVFRGQNEPRIVLRGINISDANEQNQELELKQFAEQFAGRYVNLLAKPFTSDREVLFEDLRTASVALMPSWHEGFGLVAWEAIAAGVPLILSKKSGVFQFLNEFEKGKCLNWITCVDILGQSDAPFFRDEDKEAIAEALLKIAQDPSEYRDKAVLLRKELIDKFSWLECATQFASYIGWHHLTAQPLLNFTHPKDLVNTSLSINFKRYKAIGKIKNFRDSYLTSDLGSVAFGGRDQEIQFLNSWLQEDSSPKRLLITAPTGRGKSALLVRWTEDLLYSPVGESWQIVFVPISMRFNTNRPSVFYELIASRLAEIDGKPVQSPLGDPEGFYTGVIAKKLNDLAESNLKILMVIDGVDEAIGQRFDATIFPVTLPVTMKVIVSARQLLGDQGSNGWKTRLEWDGVAQVSTIELTTLDKAGIEGVLKSIVASDFGNDVTERVLELTVGEPLLARLYAEDIASMYKCNGTFSLVDLINIKPGFAAFFSRWLGQQRQAWEEEGREIDEPLLEAIFKIFSCAFGPIQEEHFSLVLSKIAMDPPSISIGRLFDPIRRFINGDGGLESGYVLNHPKFGEFLREEYFNDMSIQKIQLEFVNWGNTVLERAILDKNDQTDISPYLLQYYSRHLDAVHASITMYEQLLSKEWCRSWQRFEGGYRGFCSDVQSVLHRVGSTVHYYPNVSEMVRIRIRAALCLSSVQSTASNLPSELLAFAMDENLITLKQAIHLIEFQPTENQPQFYIAIFKHLGEEQIDPIISAISKTADIGNRTQHLIDILPYIAGAKRDQIIVDLSHLILIETNPFRRVNQLLQFAEYDSSNLLVLAFEQIQLIPKSAENITAIAMLLAKLFANFKKVGDSVNAEVALVQSKSLLNEITDIQWLAAGLPEFSKYFPSHIIQEFVDKCVPIIDSDLQEFLTPLQSESNRLLVECRTSDMLKVRAGIILLRAKINADLNFEVELKKALSLLDHVSIEMHKVEIIAPHLWLIKSEFQEQTIRDCFAISCNCASANNRLHSMLKLAKHASGTLRTEIVREALKNAQAIEDEVARGNALVALFSCMSQEDKNLEFSRVFTELNKIGDALNRGRLFVELASCISDQAEILRELGYQLLFMSSDVHNRTMRLLDRFNDFSESKKLEIFRKSFLDLLQDKSAFSGFSFAAFADRTQDFWCENELESAFQYCLTLDNDWNVNRMLAALVSIAVRLDRIDIVKVFIEKNRKHNITSDQIQNFKLSWASLRSLQDNACDAYVSEMWDKTLILGSQEKADAQIDLVPLFGVKHQLEKWTAAKASVNENPGNHRLLKKLSDLCVDDAEKNEIRVAAFAISDKIFPSPFPPINRDSMTQLKVIDLITAQTGCNRSTLLASIATMSPVFQTLGGSGLVRMIAGEILENAERWP